MNKLYSCSGDENYIHQNVFLTMFIILICLFFSSCKANEEIIPQFTSSNTGPYILNLEHLEVIDSLRVYDSDLNRAFERLVHGADSLLTVSFSYVIDKETLAPSGDPHDYMSLHRYSYPNNYDGTYTEIVDGKTNPEFYQYDKPKLEKISFAIYALSLAYYYTENEDYAEKAAREIKNWFINPETRMNPNMKYASYRPGIPESINGAGVVGATDFVDVIEATSLLYDSPHWTPDLHYQLKEWIFEFYAWMYNEYPADAYSTSNISTWLDVQRGVYLLFTEQNDKLNSSRHIQPVSQRLTNQIEATGFQPYESSRGISQHYVYFNLKAYMNLSALRKNNFISNEQDRDWPVLKNCTLNNCEFGGLKAALDNVSGLVRQENVKALFASDPGFSTCRYLEIFRPAAILFENKQYEETSQNLIRNGCNSSYLLLSYPPLNAF